MRKLLLVLIVIFGLACVFLFIRRESGYKLELTTYFADAQGLRPGAAVRLAGVPVGRVSSVRVHPELRENPAEVKMRLLTDYELRIPSDSTVSLSTAGVLGEIYLNIDVHDAYGPPVQNKGSLRSVASDDMTKAVLKQLGKMLDRTHCDPESEDHAATARERATVKPR